MSNSAKKSPPNRSKTAQSASTTSGVSRPYRLSKTFNDRPDVNTRLKKKFASSWKAYKANSRSLKSVDGKDSIPTFIIGGSDRLSGKEFLEAGKKRLAGDTTREATAPEVQSIKSENEALKQLVAELSRFGGPTGE